MVLERKTDNVAVTNAVRMFNQITDANIGSFHFHGDDDSFPLSAVIAVPHDAKSQALLLGRYQSKEGSVQMVRPVEQMDALMSTLFQAERLALLLLAVLGVLVTFIAALVFALSFKLRRREFATLEDIGVSKGTMRLVKFFEVLMVSALAFVVVAAAMSMVQSFGAALVRLVANR
jgi:putative ABC transport system permease protein